MTASKPLHSANQPIWLRNRRAPYMLTTVAAATFWVLFATADPVSASQCRLPGLELYLPMNGDFNDASGNDHHGVATGNPTFIQSTTGGAALFDGIDDSVVETEPGSRRQNRSPMELTKEFSHQISS